MADDKQGKRWTEEDSKDFIKYVEYFVPERAVQIETFCRMLPKGGSVKQILELCCGDGTLSRALLEASPQSEICAYDGSEEMLKKTEETLAPFRGRFRLKLFNLMATDWRETRSGFDYIVSSLAIHHLDGPQKQALFVDIFRALRPGGRFLVADIVEPITKEANDYAGWLWGEMVRSCGEAMGEGEQVFEAFQKLEWNHFLEEEPDEIDKPSTLFDQLEWLRNAGFENVDVFWMKAGHAIFGGDKPKP